MPVKKVKSPASPATIVDAGAKLASRSERGEQKLKVKSEKTKVTAEKQKVVRQVLTGRVVSTKNTKTATVLVSRQKNHPVYKKAFTQTKKYLVHDPFKTTEGDLVEIVKVRPISKNKHWQINKVVGKDIEAVLSEQLKEEAAEAIAEVLPEKEEPEEVNQLTNKTVAKQESEERGK